MSEINKASFDDNEQSISFEYDIPVVEGVFRKSSVKGFYRNGKIITLWVSALVSVWDGDYGSDLIAIKESFRPI